MEFPCGISDIRQHRGGTEKGRVPASHSLPCSRQHKPARGLRLSGDLSRWTNHRSGSPLEESQRGEPGTKCCGECQSYPGHLLPSSLSPASQRVRGENFYFCFRLFCFLKNIFYCSIFNLLLVKCALGIRRAAPNISTCGGGEAYSCKGRTMLWENILTCPGWSLKQTHPKSLMYEAAMANLMTKGSDGMTLEAFLQNIPKRYFTWAPNSFRPLSHHRSRQVMGRRDLLLCGSWLV